MKRALQLMALAAVVSAPAQAAEFRWAGQTDPQTLDPHAVNSAQNSLSIIVMRILSTSYNHIPMVKA